MMKKIKALLIIMTLLVIGFLSALQVIAAESGIIRGDGPRRQLLEGGPPNPRKYELPPDHYIKYRLEEGYFECEFPNDWVDIRDKRDDERVKVYGMVLVRRRNSEVGIKPWIQVSYYAAGNHYFPCADNYLKIQFEPPLVRLEGEKISEIQEVLVNGKKARQFMRDTFEFWPPHSMNTKEIRVRKEYTVLEAEQGFFVFMYSAPGNQFIFYRPDYQHILDTFKPFPVDNEPLGLPN
jgi:hypothetical protein